jgi:hypothetical protein
MRNINIDLTGYSKIINKKILNRVANKKHTMANMPYYDKSNEPTKLYEEQLIESRFKELSNSYSRSFNTDITNIDPFDVMINAAKNGYMILSKEKPKRSELVKLAEKIGREQFNLSNDEVIFDLELVNPGDCSFPGEIDKEQKIEEDFVQSTDFDVLKKRTINALSQGSALKSHYIFHLYADEFNKLCPGITDNYQKALIANDLIYFTIDDDQFQSGLCSGDDSNNSGYCRINFDGDVPVIEAKAINTPILIHEITKAIITLLSIPGIQNMREDIADETDFIMSELWEIRFGANIWNNFHSLISVDDYDIKKLIIMDIFKIDSETFVNEFMYNVLNNPELAKKEINFMVKDIRKKISNYQFLNDSSNDDINPSDYF